MFDILFFKNVDDYIFIILEDIFVVIMLYSFIKLIVLSSVIELVWPTQFFNRKNIATILNFRLRTFTETMLKLKNQNLTFSYFFIKNNLK